MSKETKDEFAKRRIDGNVHDQFLYDNGDYVVMACNCDEVEGNHWAWIRNDKWSIHHQLNFNTPGQETKQIGGVNENCNVC